MEISELLHKEVFALAVTGKVLSSIMKKMTALLFILACATHALISQTIPLPEHPRPDFERSLWQNLNGVWQFEFDSLDQGRDKKWHDGKTPFTNKITVPFPWGSELSGVKDKADIAWYQRTITIPVAWKNKRTFLTVGASDWETTIWLDGILVGSHQGGYTPFSFELTPHLNYGQQQKLIVRVDDKRRDFTLYGKQGYGNARGIWQTVYLEARGKEYIDAVHFRPDIENNSAMVTVYLPEEASADHKLSITIKTPSTPITREVTIPKGKDKINVTVSIPQARLWTMQDPYLYEVEAKLNDDGVKTYFGIIGFHVSRPC